MLQLGHYAKPTTEKLEGTTTEQCSVSALAANLLALETKFKQVSSQVNVTIDKLELELE
jgi:hypothetical protein